MEIKTRVNSKDAFHMLLSFDALLYDLLMTVLDEDTVEDILFIFRRAMYITIYALGLENHMHCFLELEKIDIEKFIEYWSKMFEKWKKADSFNDLFKEEIEKFKEKYEKEGKE